VVGTEVCQDMNPARECAEAWTRIGGFVFPLYPFGPISHWPRAATLIPDPAWWRTGVEQGIAVATGPSELLVLDVDVKRGKQGAASLLDLQIEGLPPTWEQPTPSGGKHLVYSTRGGPAARSTVEKLGSGLDTRGAGGFIRVYSSPPASRESFTLAPAWFRARVGAPGERSPDAGRPFSGISDLASALQYLGEAEPSIEGSGGQANAYRVIAMIRDWGVPRESVLELLLESGWNDRCEPPWSGEELVTICRSVYRYATSAAGVRSNPFTPVAPAAGPGPLERMNTQYAFIVISGSGRVLWETTDSEGGSRTEHLTLETFRTLEAANQVRIGGKPRELSQLWLKWPGRRTYQGIVFDPSGKAGPEWHNAWSGFAVAPDDSDSSPGLEMWREHTLRQICTGDEVLYAHVVGWLAHLVQRPAEKPLTALVLRSGKGYGKNAWIDRVGKLLGPHYLTVANPRFISGNFNSHLERCLLLTLDEAFWGGDKAGRGILYDLVTGDRHIIERKGHEAYTVKNLTRVVMLSNEAWIVPASEDERRFCVLDVGPGRKQDRAFFRDMRIELDEKGGGAQLLGWLMRQPIGDPNSIPRTVALAGQIEESLDPVLTWWLESISSGRLIEYGVEGWPLTADANRITMAVHQYMSMNRGMRSVRPTSLAIRRRLADTGAVQGKGADLSIQPLEWCRRAWEHFAGDTGWAWSPEEVLTTPAGTRPKPP